MGDAGHSDDRPEPAVTRRGVGGGPCGSAHRDPAPLRTPRSSPLWSSNLRWTTSRRRPETPLGDACWVLRCSACGEAEPQHDLAVVDLSGGLEAELLVEGPGLAFAGLVASQQ